MFNAQAYDFDDDDYYEQRADLLQELDGCVVCFRVNGNGLDDFVLFLRITVEAANRGLDIFNRGVPVGCKDTMSHIRNGLMVLLFHLGCNLRCKVDDGSGYDGGYEST